MLKVCSVVGKCLRLKTRCLESCSRYQKSPDTPEQLQTASDTGPVEKEGEVGGHKILSVITMKRLLFI